MDRHADMARLIGLICTPTTYDLRNRNEDALGWLKAEAVLARSPHEHARTDTSRHGDVRARCITLDEPISPLQLHLFLETLKLYAGSKLLRVKGFFKLTDDPDQPMVVHGVQHMISPVARLEAWPSADKRTRVVLIGRDLNIETIERILKGSRAHQPAVSTSEAMS
jgi:G3E family GTPase